jgi:hypothetical protein
MSIFSIKKMGSMILHTAWWLNPTWGTFGSPSTLPTQHPASPPLDVPVLFSPTHGCVDGVENTYLSSLCAWVWFNLSKKTSAANQQAE